MGNVAHQTVSRWGAAAEDVQRTGIERSENRKGSSSPVF